VPLPRRHERAYLSRDLRDGAHVREVVRRYRNVEMIFDLADHLEHLEGIEPEVGEQLAVERRLDRKAADPLQDVDDIPNERIRRRRRG